MVLPGPPAGTVSDPGHISAASWGNPVAASRGLSGGNETTCVEPQKVSEAVITRASGILGHP